MDFLKDWALWLCIISIFSIIAYLKKLPFFNKKLITPFIDNCCELYAYIKHKLKDTYDELEKKRELAVRGQEEAQKKISQSLANDPNDQARKNIAKKMLDKNINHKDYSNLIIMINELFTDKDFKEKMITQLPIYDLHHASELRKELIIFITEGVIEYLRKDFFGFPELNEKNSSYKMIHLMPHALTELKEKKYRAILDLTDNEVEIFNQYIDYASKSFNVIN